MSDDPVGYGWYHRNRYEAHQASLAASAREMREAERQREIEERNRQERKAMLDAMTPEERERFLKRENQADRTHCNKVWAGLTILATAIMFFIGWATTSWLNRILGLIFVGIGVGLILKGNRNPDLRDRRCCLLKIFPVVLLLVGLVTLGGIVVWFPQSGEKTSYGAFFEFTHRGEGLWIVDGSKWLAERIGLGGLQTGSDV